MLSKKPEGRSICFSFSGATIPGNIVSFKAVIKSARPLNNYHTHNAEQNKLLCPSLKHGLLCSSRVLKEEHRVGAKYEVDVELTFDFTGAAEHDDLTRTVDYGAVYSRIREALTMKKYFLIEAVSFEIATDLLRDFEIVDRVSVRVRKRNPPVDGICDYAEADFTAARH